MPRPRLPRGEAGAMACDGGAELHAVPSSTLGAGAGTAHGQRRGDVLQRLALGGDTDEGRHEATHDHDAGTEQVPAEQRAPVLAVTDERAVDDRAQGAEALGDGEE